MPETTTAAPHIPFAGNPPGNQSSFLQALLGRKVYVATLVVGGHENGILRGWDASTITLEVKAHENLSDSHTFPMLIFKHAIISITTD